MSRIESVAAIDEAAQRLLRAAQECTPCAPIRDLLGPTNIDAAYQVQRRIVAAAVTSGRRVIGSKIGLTASSVQRQFNVYQPDFGVLFADTVYSHGSRLPSDAFLQPRAEGEIAFVLHRDLDRPGATVADVLAATDFITPAIEIVDSRISNWDLTIVDTVADNASSGAAILGAAAYSPRDRDLSRIGMTLEINGQPVSFGAGHACLGSPVVAVAWLARELARRDQPLRSGDIVMSGALGPMVPLGADTAVRLRLDGLGEVETYWEGTVS